MEPSQDPCAICLDELKDKVAKTNCGHTFHKKCLKKAILHCPKCPYCRTKFRMEWLIQQELLQIRELGIMLERTPRPLQNRSAGQTYWEQVENTFEEPPLIGPMLPSQQRWYNMDILEETTFRPPNWSELWIADRLAEMRIRFNIGPEITLTAQDLHICELNGILGIQPEWMPFN